MEPIDELNKIGAELCRNIAAHRYGEAQQLLDRFAALHSLSTHHFIMSILERARGLTIAQRSFASMALANLQSANQYSTDVRDQKRITFSG